MWPNPSEQIPIEKPKKPTRPPTVPLALTAQDVDDIIEAIEEFVIGPSDPDGELDAIWGPYIDKLQHLKTGLRG